MAVSENNRRRYRSILIARDVKGLFQSVPEIFAALLSRWIWRWLFLGRDNKPHRAGEVVLAEIRRLTLLDQPSVFHSDPLVMAYREGKRSVGMKIMMYLNLDEHDVQKLMELDDGLGN